MVKNFEKVREAYQKKVFDLEKVRDSNYPAAMSPELYAAHERKVGNAIEYLDELDSIEAFMSLKKRVLVVTLKEAKKLIRQADYSSIEFKGKFVKLIFLQKFGCPDKWLLCMEPLNVL